MERSLLVSIFQHHLVLQETERDAEYESLAGNNKGKLKKNNRYGKILLNPNLYTYVQGKKVEDHVKPSNNFYGGDHDCVRGVRHQVCLPCLHSQLQDARVRHQVCLHGVQSQLRGAQDEAQYIWCKF